MNIRYDKNTYTAILQTALSAVFNTFTSDILIEKSRYYRVKDSELQLMNSFLRNRHQYVTIGTFHSKTKKSLDCSVVQGSILSAILYTI